MKSIVISAFAGVGKTTLTEKYPKNICDLESSDYQWIYDDKDIEEMPKESRKGISQRRRNPAWPDNYVQAIKENAEKYDIILIAQQQIVRDAAKNAGIEMMLCYPGLECKEEYINRYRERGNQEQFLKLMEENYDIWISALAEAPEKKLVLRKGQFLEEILIEQRIIPIVKIKKKTNKK